MSVRRGKPGVLVAPLNWGLGHATRCVPIVRELQAQNARVFVGSDGASLTLLQTEFPDARFVELPSYDISYGKGGFVGAVLPQIPKILLNIGRERQFADNFAKQHGIRAIISDNRFGCRSEATYNVFVTHQLFLRMPPALKMLEPLATKANCSYIGKFDACWIPDFAQPEDSLSGVLSHGQLRLPDGFCSYIGPLSRLQGGAGGNLSKKYDLAAIVSGPEPQRSLFERLLLAEFAKLPHLRCLLLRGRPGGAAGLGVLPNVEMRNHANAKEMNRLMRQSHVVVARSGYSTVMDLAATGGKAILIPTPGQTEQEYLAVRFEQRKVFAHLPQDGMDLGAVLPEMGKYSGLVATWPPSGGLRQAVRGLLAAIA